MVLTVDPAGLSFGEQAMQMLGGMLEFLKVYGWNNVVPTLAMLALGWVIFMVFTGRLIPRFYFDLVRADNDKALDRSNNMAEGLKEVTDFLQQIKAADAEQDAEALKVLMAAIRNGGASNTNHGEPPSGGGGG